MNPKLDYTVPADEIPQVRLSALEAAWADDNKLADACDNPTVQRWLRRTRSGLNTIPAQAHVATMIERTITAAFEADPSFADWCDEAREKMATEDSSDDDDDDDPEIRAAVTP